MKRITRVKEERPELLSDAEVHGLVTDADRIEDLKKISETPEGKTLIKLLLTDYRAKATRLHAIYRTANRDELVSIIASMETAFDTASLLVGADKLLSILDSEIEEALRE